MQVSRFDNFRIVIGNRAREDHHVAAADILRYMTDRHLDTGLAQVAGHGILAGIGARHAVAKDVQHLSDTPHAGATDTDEVDVVNPPHPGAAIRRPALYPGAFSHR